MWVLEKRGLTGASAVRSHPQRCAFLPTVTTRWNEEVMLFQGCSMQPVVAKRHRQLQPRAAAAVSLAPPPAKQQQLNVPRGETAGAVLTVNDLLLSAAADRDLMSDVQWRVMPGERWGLVGANGAGKSTLLKALAGIRQVDAGQIRVAPKVEVGYLAQTAVSGSQRTVWEEARSQMTRLIRAEEDMHAAEQALAAGDTSAVAALASAQEAYALAGGHDSEKRITNVLKGLGFRPEQFHISASQFSGGWQMRIALARLLLGKAGQAASAGLQGGLMLLDEPTNHLDSAAIKWLGNFLRSSGGTLVVVSHDEALLEDVCDHIAEVRGRKLHLFTGSFSSFLEQRAMREAQATATAAAQQQEIERLETFVKRFGAKASKASQAQSKAKLAEKLRAEMVEVPVAAASSAGGDAKKVHLRLPRAPPCFTDVLTLSGASVGWGDPQAPGATPLVQNVNLVIKKGMRVLVLGPNGAGKSTLLKALGGSLPLWKGARKEGEGVQLGVFSQDLAQDLPLEKPALQYVEDVARAHDRSITMEKCRAALGALGLTGATALQPIGVLSGGEKARVALAGFALVPSNVLLLDEASNHLDAATIEVLTGALQEFTGAIVAITHNKAFAESLSPTHVLRVPGDGTATLSTNMGLSAKDFEHKTVAAPAKQQASSGSKAAPSKGSGNSSTNGKATGKGASSSSSSAPAAAAAQPSSGSSSDVSDVSSSKQTKKRTTLSWNEQQEYQKLQKLLPALTKKRDELQEKVAQLAQGSDFKALEAATTELGKVAGEVDEREMRWLELAELAGDI